MENKRQARKVSVFIGIIMVCLSFLVCGVIVNKERAQSQSAYAIEEGGSIYIKNGATYTMNGGSIKNKSAEKGGIIYVSSGATFIMNGGTLSGGNASKGGAIYVASGGEVYLNGGTIKDCDSSGGGNAVYVEDGGYLEMTGDFTITSSGANYIESIKAINPANVKRPIVITPYVKTVEQTPIHTYSNVLAENLVLPEADGCGWYYDNTYTENFVAFGYVSDFVPTDEGELHHPDHSYNTWQTVVPATCSENGTKNSAKGL